MTVTWLTPYYDAYTQHVGAIAFGRLAKALAPARDLLGDEACQRAFAFYCEQQDGRSKSPEWFAKECRMWLQRATRESEAVSEPVVNEYGMLTEAGRKVYGR